MPGATLTDATIGLYKAECMREGSRSGWALEVATRLRAELAAPATRASRAPAMFASTSSTLGVEAVAPAR